MPTIGNRAKDRYTLETNVEKGMSDRQSAFPPDMTPPITNLKRNSADGGMFTLPQNEETWKKFSNTVSMMLGIKIGDYCNFNDRMYGYMTRLMLINQWEKNTTLSMLCDIVSNQAIGDSDIIAPQAEIPTYTEGNNYLVTARKLKVDQKHGDNTTRLMLPPLAKDEVYPTTINLYPDELDQLNSNVIAKEQGLWSVTDPNSILYKTKCLFQQRKIKTLISRFGTNTDATSNNRNIHAGESVAKFFGESHGRNLLTKEAEQNPLGNYNRNGYNNPYCRVWTHHYQYDNYSKLIRPNTERSLMDIHNLGEEWDVEEDKANVINGIAVKGTDRVYYGWKDQYPKWENSVLSRRGDGLVNITPKFLGGKAKNIHAKDCMFSIENLAWKDYDPYSFSTALSWEQRGPMGGRIMWFPPYGLSFTETSQAQWNANTFIGRGEDVYTYVNTKRTGTLQFMMVVDHPSILDYVTWYEANRDKVSETDILRFFAGCDPMNANDPNSLLYYAKPTPLTDEEGRREVKQGKKPIQKEKTTKEATPDAKTTKVHFNVYYPNNYSGYFDREFNGKDALWVMEYLLSGKNAQETYEIVGTQPKATIQEIDFEHGFGYEITDAPITTTSSQNEGIIGNKEGWPNNGTTKAYNPDKTKIWKYRIDGMYTPPTAKQIKGQKYKYKENNNSVSNTYAQTLTKSKFPDSYTDSQSFQLNSSLKNQAGVSENSYTFTEVFEAIANTALNPSGYDKVRNFFEHNNTINDSERVKKLEDLFKNSMDEKSGITLSGISLCGYSSVQGKNPNTDLNEARNKFLARERGTTILQWLTESMGEKWINNATLIQDHKSNMGNSRGKSESDKEAKIYRCCHCILTFNEAKTEVQATTPTDDTNEEEEAKNLGLKPTGKTNSDFPDMVEYVDKENKLWYYNKKTAQYIKADRMDFANEELWDRIRRGDKTIDPEQERKDQLFNQLRYDQEYHFFRKLEKDSPLVYTALMDKLKIFDPAFHSMTPEGFNARLTFLHQCTRQGNTIGASDGIYGKTASNMAFGRPPFCMLRIGDFYNQMIVIDNINMQYDTSGGIVWDLNDEGIGVQPMLAQISINFTFIGGGDLGGAVRRLQNSQSFNFYANASLYDNRADRVVYDVDMDGITMGGANHGTLDKDNSYAHSVINYDPEVS